jgi:ABC-type transport system substrate-binding protein
VNFVNFLAQDDFNPALSTSADAEYVFFDYIYDTLLDESKDGTKVIPGLAESYRIVDPNTLEVKLREGLQYSNGDPLTSAEVKASVEYAKAKSPENPRRIKTWVNLTEVQTPDPLTVRFVFSTPEAFNTVYEITGVPGMILHPSIINGTGTEPIGAGPFKLDRYAPEQIAEMSKNDRYYDADKILLAGLNIVNVELGPASLTALRSEAIDFVTTDAQTIKQLDGNSRFGTSSMPGFTYYNVYLRHVGPMENVKFRQALSTALDRDALNDAVQAGIGETTVQPYPKRSPYHNKAVAKSYKYSMSKARKLLKESGVPAGTTIDIVYPGQAANVEQLRQAEIIKSQWEKLGIKVNLIPAPDTPAIIEKYYTNPNAHGFAATTVGKLGPIQQVKGRFFKGQFVAESQKSVLPDAEALYNQFVLDPEDPKPVQDAVALMVQDADEIPIMFRNRNLAWDANRIGGPILAPTEVTDNVELKGVYIKKS